MLKVEVYIDDKETPADVEAVRYAVEAAAEAWGVVRHVRVKDMSPRQIGFGDLERGEIVSCEGVKLLYRDGHYDVETDKLIRRFWYAFTAVNGFTERIGEVLQARMKRADIGQPSFEDLAEVPAGYEEHTWYEQAMQTLTETDE